MIHSKYSSRAVFFLAFLPMVVSAQSARGGAIPLKNWPTPLYWRANRAEREAAGKPAPQLLLSGSAVSGDALTFVAVTPCRLVDTRGMVAGFDGILPFSGPAIAAASTLTIPVQSIAEAITNTIPAPCGTIPSYAEAYSLNVTVVPAGIGAVNYITLWPAAASQPLVSTLNDVLGTVVAGAAIVPAGTPDGGVSVYNSGPAPVNVIIDMNGFFAAPTTPVNGNTAIGSGTLTNNTNGAGNTAAGDLALNSNTSGSSNTASGNSALQTNTTGSFNTASGNGALQLNTSGAQNTASGASALLANTTGAQNTANGANALLANTIGGFNTANGVGALQNNTTGVGNTASGFQALLNNITGNSNIALGNGAGSGAPAANMKSIYIGNPGANSDASGTIHIGTSGTQSSFFVAGVNGVTTGLGNAVDVVIDSNGQLGTIASSQRFKEDIHDMGDASNGLLRLRPVTFRYKQAYNDGSKPLDYGLIAEEVAKIYPNLVVRGKDGQIQTVQYQKLTPMLLNELQNQAEQNRQQAEQIEGLEDRLEALEALLAGDHEPVR
ncbi:MAG: tail fiber domain-containing protein [Bryobacterales bacterium]|nr:tail fiber domain-containing protein [Bryobacterales bacterium]